VTVGMSENYGANTTRTGSASMAAAGSETRVLAVVEDVEAGGDTAYAVAVSVGDSAAVASVQWTLDALIVPVEQRQDLVVG